MMVCHYHLNLTMIILLTEKVTMPTSLNFWMFLQKANTAQRLTLILQLLNRKRLTFLNIDYNYSGISKQLLDALYTEVDWGCVMNHKIFESISNTVHTANLQIL